MDIESFFYSLPRHLHSYKDKTSFTLTQDTDYQATRTIADHLLDSGITTNTCEELNQSTSPLFLRMGALLAQSRLALLKHKETPFRIAIIMNLIHEHNRLLPNSPDNPNGENALRNKLKQLEWITHGTNTSAELIFVTGGCPWGSEDVLASLMKDVGDTIPVQLFDIRNSSQKEQYTLNQKGSELIFGGLSALQTPGYPDSGSFDALLFTDADMTLDLGQIGTLVDLIQTGNQVIIGERTHEQSIFQKNVYRPGPGLPLYRHIQRRLGLFFFEHLGLHDTQCPWKCFSREAFSRIAPKLDSMDWSWDGDFISGAHAAGLPITIIPVSAIDSDAESHGHTIGVEKRMFPILQGTLHQMRKYELPYDEEIAAIFEQTITTDHDLKRILESAVPQHLEHTPLSDFGNPQTISPQELLTWIKSL